MSPEALALTKMALSVYPLLPDTLTQKQPVGPPAEQVPEICLVFNGNIQKLDRAGPGLPMGQVSMLPVAGSPT